MPLRKLEFYPRAVGPGTSPSSITTLKQDGPKPAWARVNVFITGAPTVWRSFDLPARRRCQTSACICPAPATHEHAERRRQVDLGQSRASKPWPG